MIKKAAKRSQNAEIKAILPRVSWLVLARNLIADRSKRSVSAIEIVEDLFLPASVFSESEELNAIEIGQTLTLAFTLDWVWPQEASNIPINLTIDWYAPSGNGYSSNHPEAEPLKKPTKGSRTRIEVKLNRFPIEQPGIYHLQIMMNEEGVAKYPIRIRPLVDEPSEEIELPSAPKKKVPTRRKTATRKV